MVAVALVVIEQLFLVLVVMQVLFQSLVKLIQLQSVQGAQEALLVHRQHQVVQTQYSQQ